MTQTVHQSRRTAFYGKYRGVVTDNDDPFGRGRLRARVPSVLADVETGWALPCSPYTGAGSGFYTMPPAGAGVWIEFEGGDVDRPIWSGGWWGDDQLPSHVGGSTTPQQKVWRSEQGLVVTLDDAERTISVSDPDGTNLIRIEVSHGEVRVQAASKVVVEAPLIELVEGGSHPVAFGDSLLQYLDNLVQLFNTHLHPGETCVGIPVTPAVPAPPFPTASPSLLSTRVKAG